MKKLFSVVAVIAVGGCVVYFLTQKKSENLTPVAPTDEISMCYTYSKEALRGFFDDFSLRLNILGNTVTGEYKSSPAEKDYKAGPFEGTVGVLEQKSMSRTADVFWNSFAEGMHVKEELLIKFGDGSAVTGATGLINRGDEVYIIPNKSKTIFGGPTLSQVACSFLDEKEHVEKYIRDNIKTIATNKPALGGSWYVIGVHANPAIHTANVVYEDGHIRSKAEVLYEIKPSGEIFVQDFKVAP